MGLQPRKTAHLEEDEPVLPLSTSDDPSSKSRRSKSPAALKIVVGHPIALLALLATLLYFTLPTPTGPVSVFGFEFPFPKPSPAPHPPHVVEGLAKCKVIAKSPPTFNSLQNLKRSHNDRYAPGTQDTLLKNATIWTGNKDGEEVIHGGDVLLVNGLVKKIGKGLQVEQLKREGLVKSHVEEVELDGAWLTPGIVDMHSHLAVDAAPSLRGSADTNSILGPVLPWLRSLDGFDTHDQAFNLSISGGITTMLVLPGSADNIGGQAFTFKPRWTKENTPESMLVEPPFVTKNGTWERTGAWRHIKHACGENPSRVYGQTRMDSAYNFRAAYDNGKRLKDAQERWCASPTTQTEPFPDSLEWEVLADVIRGNVKVNIHCYETVDLNDLVRISNEYKFHIAAFHHAHETYLVPDLLKRTYGGNPFVAIFATNARYKKEAWRGSEFAPKILTDAGLDVTMKSDHPVLDSRYLMFEAAQAHHYGLNFSKALSSVTVNSARAVGLDHRLGYVREGYDADLVVWDSFPLNLGATPKQTYIDGIPQLLNPFAVSKPASAQEISKEGVWTEEIQEALDTRGDPDLRPKKSNGNIIFQNVQESFLPDNQIIASSSLVSGRQANTTVVVVEGKIACVGECVEVRKAGLDFDVIDLKGGSIAPGLISVGSGLGLKEIDQEKSTQDGAAYNALTFNPELIDGLVVHAVDGVSFGGKNTLLSYRGGVTQGVTPPQSSSFFQGLSFAFSTSAEHPLSDNAILNPSAALHLQLDNSQYSVSTKLAVLRRLLQNGTGEDTELTRLVNEVKHGAKTLVVHVNKADYIATLVRLKRDVAPGMKLTILGGAESWIVADELAKEDVGVIVTPARSFPGTWDQRRILPGPPLSQHTLPSYLAERGVKVGLGIVEEWQARNTRYEAAWTYTSSGSTFTKQTALDLVSKNLEELLGLSDRKAGVTLGEEGASWVAYEGDLFSMEGRVRAVKAHGSATIDLF